MNSKDSLAQLGSLLGCLMFIWAVFQQCFPQQLRNLFDKYTERWASYFYPYIKVRFNEFNGDTFKRAEAYSAIENYLASNASQQAKRLKADVAAKKTAKQSLVLSMDDNEEVADEFQGVKLWWTSGKHSQKSQTISWYQSASERRYYKLMFHKRNRDLILGPYLRHVLQEGNVIKTKNRQRKLYTNDEGYWSHVVFEHPARFETLAMEPEAKEEIIEDLVAFSQAEEFYARIGRAWKRGYLLHGPPGTGKSTMVAAMANLLNYDVYDLELTAVKNNTELRRLLIEISSKAIIVVEDIDCSLDLTGQRKKKKKKSKKNKTKKNKKEEESNSDEEKGEEDEDEDEDEDDEKEGGESQVTLSGLLNFIDGIWSSCGGERVLVFTTNHVEKLDPALIRKGRMDKHVEMSFCGFEAFKVLAKNYLGVQDHVSFDRIRGLLAEVNMTPADVAEHLMPKRIVGDCDASLRSLVDALEKARDEKQSVNDS